MTQDFFHQLPKDFHPASKVWIYQSTRLFTPQESHEIKIILEKFTANWTSHGAKVKGFATVLLDHFILFMADERATGVSGCSTDSSVRIVKEIENIHGLELFNRQLLAFYKGDKLELIPLSAISDSINQNKISAETLYFNNTILTKKELETNWIIELKNSWLKNKMK